MISVHRGPSDELLLNCCDVTQTLVLGEGLRFNMEPFVDVIEVYLEGVTWLRQHVGVFMFFHVFAFYPVLHLHVVRLHHLPTTTSHDWRDDVGLWCPAKINNWLLDEKNTSWTRLEWLLKYAKYAPDTHPLLPSSPFLKMQAYFLAHPTSLRVPPTQRIPPLCTTAKTQPYNHRWPTHIENVKDINNKFPPSWPRHAF